ncbi:MAG: TIGR03936 family radical SAM-associated protein [Clostridia bacterium]
MERLLVVYSKAKDAIFLSHFDTMRVIQESILRANIPVKYLKDTNRVDITFAHSLSIGLESTGEIFELLITEDMQPAYFIKAVNKVLPNGITILTAESIDLNFKSIMTRVYAATYVIDFVYDEKKFENKSKKEIQELKNYYKDKMEEYINQPYLLVLKKSKNRMERIDIKSQIIVHDFALDGSLEVTISAGSRINLNPECIMNGYREYIEENILYNIKRTRILYN